MPRWEDEPWEPVRDNWDARGLAYEPSAGQRRKLWPVLVEFPELVGDWVAEAPVEDSTTYGVVRHVLAAAAGERLRQRLPELFAALSEEERGRWREEERAWPRYLKNPLYEARQSGKGLPADTAGENPFRLALPKMVQERQALKDLFRPRPRTTEAEGTAATREGAGDAWINL